MSPAEASPKPRRSFSGKLVALSPMKLKKTPTDSKTKSKAEHAIAAESQEEMLASSEDAVLDSMGELLAYMENEVVAARTIAAIQVEVKQERERTYVLERRMTEEKLELEATRRLGASHSEVGDNTDNDGSSTSTEGVAAKAAASERAVHAAAARHFVLQALLLVALIVGVWVWMSARGQSPVVLPEELAAAVPVRRVCLKLPAFTKAPKLCLPMLKK